MYGFVREDQTNVIWWSMQFYRLPSVFNEWILLNKQQNIELHRWFFCLALVCFLRFFFIFLLESAFIVLGHTRSGWTLNFTRHTIECRCWEITDTMTISSFHWEFISSFSGLSLFFTGSVAKLDIEKHFFITFTISIFKTKWICLINWETVIRKSVVRRDFVWPTCTIIGQCQRV